jgi:hypothetical protein
MVAYCNFVVISKFTDYRLVKIHYSVDSGAVIAHMVRRSGFDDSCSVSGGGGEYGYIAG